MEGNVNLPKYQFYRKHSVLPFGINIISPVLINIVGCHRVSAGVVNRVHQCKKYQLRFRNLKYCINVLWNCLFYSRDLKLSSVPMYVASACIFKILTFNITCCSNTTAKCMTWFVVWGKFTQHIGSIFTQPNQISRFHMQSKIDNGTSILGSYTLVHINLIRRIQNLLGTIEFIDCVCMNSCINEIFRSLKFWFMH